MAQANVVDRHEAQKRAPVFTKEPKTILVKILAMGKINGVPFKERDNTAIEVKRIVEADQKNLDPFAYRENRGDTGYCLFEKEVGVRVDNLVIQLKELGYRLVGMHWAQQNGKGPVTTFEFSRDGTEIRMPTEAQEVLLKCRFNNGTVWCNLRDGDDGKQFRLDTINIAKGRVTDEPSRQLSIEGNTYRLN